VQALSLLPTAPAHAQTREWRALAVAGNGINASWGYGYTRQEAEQKAVWQCTLNAPGCRVVMAFNRGCGARAYTSRGGWGTGRGCSKLEAEANAMTSCRNAGNAGCRSPWAYCTTPCGR
jgi:hypothetical protein